MQFKYITKPLTEIFIKDAVLICNNELGEDYLDFQTLKDLINNENSLVIGIFKSDQELIGFGICSFFNKSEFKQSIHQSQYNQLPEVIKKSENIGITNTLVVRDNYKGLGVGTLIFKNSIDFLMKNSINTISGFAWKNKKGVNMERIFEKNGFSKIKTIEKFWSEESIENNYSCPECGNPPCNCSSIIYFKKINDFNFKKY